LDCNFGNLLFNELENIGKDADGDGVATDLKRKGALNKKDGHSKKEVVDAAQTVADDYAENLQGDAGEKVEVIVYDGLYVDKEKTDNGVDKSKTEGFHESDTRKIYINIDKMGNTEDLVSTIAHEMNHVDDMDKAVTYDGLDGKREDVAHGTGDQMKEFFQDDFGAAKNNYDDNQSWLANQDFSRENEQVNGVRKAEPNIYLFGNEKLKVPFPGEDFDLHFGVQESYVNITRNAGSDTGMKSNFSFNSTPSIGASVYGYFVLREKESNASVNYGIKNGTTVDNYLDNNNQVIGAGGSVGIFVPTPWNFKINTNTSINDEIDEFLKRK